MADHGKGGGGHGGGTDYTMPAVKWLLIIGGFMWLFGLGPFGHSRQAAVTQTNTAGTFRPIAPQGTQAVRRPNGQRCVPMGSGITRCYDW